MMSKKITISVDDLFKYLREVVHKHGFWGRVTIEFVDGEPVEIIKKEETVKVLKG